MWHLELSPFRSSRRVFWLESRLNATKPGLDQQQVVGNRYMEKRVNVRIEHVRHSKCRQEFIDRVKSNAEKKKEAKASGTHVELKRLPAAPRESRTISVGQENAITTLTALPYDTVRIALSDNLADWADQAIDCSTSKRTEERAFLSVSMAEESRSRLPTLRGVCAEVGPDQACAILCSPLYTAFSTSAFRACTAKHRSFMLKRALRPCRVDVVVLCLPCHRLERYYKLSY